LPAFTRRIDEEGRGGAAGAARLGNADQEGHGRQRRHVVAERYGDRERRRPIEAGQYAHYVAEQYAEKHEGDDIGAQGVGKAQHRGRHG
jgi:hypothetical protein